MSDQNMQHVSHFVNDLHDLAEKYVDVINIPIMAAIGYRFACMLAMNANPEESNAFQGSVFLLTDPLIGITPDIQQQLDELLIQINVERNGQERA